MTSGFLRLATAILCLAFCGEGFPQAYPNKPISMVVPLGPGSQADNVARVLAERLQAVLGQRAHSRTARGPGTAAWRRDQDERSPVRRPHDSRRHDSVGEGDPRLRRETGELNQGGTTPRACRATSRARGGWRAARDNP